MIQSLSNVRGCGATTLACPRVNIHRRRSSSTMSVPNLLVNVQHITHTRALSNRQCAIPQPEKSCTTRRVTVYYLPTLSRRGCPHLVVRFPFQVIRLATSTFVWLELYDVSRSLPRMRQLLSQVAVMECHSVGVRVEEKAAQCRVMEKTTCCHDTVWTGCGIWRDHWSLYEYRLQQRVCITQASLMLSVSFLTGFEARFQNH